MGQIAVIDDSHQMRSSIAVAIRSELEDIESDIAVNDFAPLADLDDYPSWIEKNDVIALVLDEKLSQIIEDGHESAVSYSGHEAGVYIRKHVHDMPIILFTSIADSNELQAAMDVESDLDMFMERKTFNKLININVHRIVRMAEKYSVRHSDELQQLTEISKRIALNEEQNGDREKLDTLRAKLEITSSFNDVSDLRDWIELAENLKKRLESAISDAGSESDKSNP